MKKIPPFLLLMFCLAFPALLPAQAELGLSGGLVFMIPKYAPVSNSLYTPYQVHHTLHLQPGIRLEGNYLLHDYPFPVSAFNGVGVTYYPAGKDSALFSARLRNNGGSVIVKGFQKTSMVVTGLRFGYEIPQNFNDFLSLHIGWGFSLLSERTRYVLPDANAQFNYTSSDFDPAIFELQKNRSACVEVLFGGAYEFEKFFLLAQYSLLYPFSLSNTSDVRFRHGLSVSAFIPLKRF